MLYEICIDSPAGALAAVNAGAHRVELCSDLLEGGLTPSAGMLKVTLQQPKIDTHVLIRPRAGDFCFTELEFATMCEDVLRAKELGASGVVIGILKPDGAIDLERSGRLVELARPLSVTFNRAFDMCRDPFQALEEIISLGINRILTSGQKRTALEGLELIARLVEKAGDRTIIMPGGGINANSMHVIARRSGANEFHFSARVTIESSMAFRNLECNMGNANESEYILKPTDESLIRKIIQTADYERGTGKTGSSFTPPTPAS